MSFFKYDGRLTPHKSDWSRLVTWPKYSSLVGHICPHDSWWRHNNDSPRVNHDNEAELPQMTWLRGLRTPGNNHFVSLYYDHDIGDIRCFCDRERMWQVTTENKNAKNIISHFVSLHYCDDIDGRMFLWQRNNVTSDQTRVWVIEKEEREQWGGEMPSDSVTHSAPAPGSPATQRY